ncbi:enoyl-ACP reductase FabI [Sessilibacter corallicola]|uniref:Enoyl-[acyl-carrier-protein] reductase [NADH] n=1 Tax=Sessilibacter corallicola TaxID=2904075 RepID=A0ABQ0A621_9GAMM
MAIINLNGKKGLIVGIANNESIAWGCSQAFHSEGATLAATYLNEKAEKYVRPLAEQVNAEIISPLNVASEEQLDALFAEIEVRWGKLDFLLHAIAFAPAEDLHGRVVDCSSQGFLTAMDISCHSFIRLAKRAEPLMKSGGSLLTVSYYGSEKVVSHYNLMGPVKAALEATVRYLAAELGRTNIRVNAISPGPIHTRAASGLEHFDSLLTDFVEKSPLHKPLMLEDIGSFAAFLVSDAAKAVTGGVHYIDCGYEIVD